MSNVVGSLDGKPSASPSGGNNAGSIPAPTAKKEGPVFRCAAIKETTNEAWRCGKPAEWIATWSDRRMFVCDGEECHDDVRRSHDNDHWYDQTGIHWEHYTGRTEYERRATE